MPEHHGNITLLLKFLKSFFRLLEVSHGTPSSAAHAQLKGLCLLSGSLSKEN